mmetsp:Transcript_170/g.434  ORF Transcript_170/g.434 Transcript_170/m.434 type:complete len:618 (+) Transcript_170:259-2112(+)|eukprot:CAMPEP_0118936526 /NCGR_PEP_ID=MMETSP1169-20130426/19337_1 /TAXON_ID=36882 /ORGANISM="Pyramimonas obovata, Strain CCMP722" /LENGTH=617 /DNA_ID=CAMNT_0006879821 /DNA_START=191 /DNA_END=2044 /DNA_ORIENTATION=+
MTQTLPGSPLHQEGCSGERKKDEEPRGRSRACAQDEQVSSTGVWKGECDMNLASNSGTASASSSAAAEIYGERRPWNLTVSQPPVANSSSSSSRALPMAPVSSCPANTVIGFETDSMIQLRRNDFNRGGTSGPSLLSSPGPALPVREATTLNDRQILGASPLTSLLRDSMMSEELVNFAQSSQRLVDVEVKCLLNCSFLDERYNAAVDAALQPGQGRSGGTNQPTSKGMAHDPPRRLLFDAEPIRGKVAALTLPDEEENNGEQREDGCQARRASLTVPIPTSLSPSSPSTSTSSSPESSYSFGSTMSLILSPLSPHRLRFRQGCYGPVDPSSSPSPSGQPPFALQASRSRPYDAQSIPLVDTMMDFSSTPASRAFGQHASTSPLTRGAFLHRRSLDRLSPDRPVGSFEECVFAGRMAMCGLNVPHVDGFTALLAVCGKGSSPVKKKLAFTAYYMAAEQEGRAPPYFASIAVDGSIGQKAEAERSERVPTSRYRVPFMGQIQLVLSNPEGTPVHTFCAKYDFRHLMPKTKTFLRQRVLAQPKSGPEGSGCALQGELRQGQLRYAMHMKFACLPHKSKKDGQDPSPGRLYLYGEVRVIFAQQKPDTSSEILVYDTILPN